MAVESKEDAIITAPIVAWSSRRSLPASQAMARLAKLVDTIMRGRMKLPPVTGYVESCLKMNNGSMA